MKIVVLAGGLSPERDVSLSSGCLISNALRKAGHRVLLIDVYEDILIEGNDFDRLFLNQVTENTYKIPENKPDLNEIKKRYIHRNSLIGRNILEICKAADVVFIALHGGMGENGQIQAIFDVMGVKYTGTGYVGSLLAMDKDLTKKILRQSALPTPDWMIFDNSVSEEKIIDLIGLPCVIKPCSAGSSIGVSVVKDRKDLNKAVDMAKDVDSCIMIEKMISGREFSIGILNEKPLPVIEIIPKEGFYDYKNKYQSGLTEEICPANLPESLTLKVQKIALEVHTALRLGSYSRIDFIMDKDEEFYCLEANTLPGMTPTSLLPQEAAAVDISYDQLCCKIVNSSINSTAKTSF